MNEKKYYGKYRAIVTDNIDLEFRGRIQVTIKDISQFMPSNWAEACTPLGGGPVPGGIYVVPQVGANVWVEFEQGDLERPIWTGCMWGAQTDVPPTTKLDTPGMPSIVLQTTLQNSIILSDLPGPTGGIMLKSTTGAMILVNDVGITISNGKGAIISMVGNAIDLNVGALTVL